MSKALLILGAAMLWAATAPALGQDAPTSAPASVPTATAPTATASAPTTKPGTEQTADKEDYRLVPPAVLGVFILLVWILRRAITPSKLMLLRAPPRQNTLSPAHAALAFCLWIALQIVAKRVPEPYYFAAMAGAQCAIVAIVLVIAYMTFRLGVAHGFGLNLRHWKADIARGVVAYLAILPVCLLLLAFMKLVLPQNLVHTHDLLTALAVLPAVWKAVVIVVAVVLAPLSEELLFRGLIQTMFRHYMKPWSAILLTGGVFAILHLPNIQDLPALVVLSAALGYSYERTGRLTAPIVLHCLFNGVTVFLWMTR